MKMASTLLVGAIFGAGTVLLWNNYSQNLKPSVDTTPENRKTFTVTHDQIKMGKIPRIHEAAGQITADQTIELSSRVSGYISQLIPTEGAIVDAGELLIEIDSATVESSIRQTKASLEETESELKDAQADVKRFRELIKTNAISEERLRKAKLRAVRASAAVDTAKAELAERQSELAYTKIKSPARARVIEHLSKAGDLAIPGNPIMRIESLGALRFETWVPISIIDKLSIGQSIALELDGKSEPIQVVVTEIVRSADPETHRCKVRLSVPENADVMVGHYGNAKFPLGVDSRPTVDNRALIQRAGIDGIFIIDSTGKSRFRSVRLGRQWNNTSELLSGPNSSVTVILNPPRYLRDGDSVSFVSPQ